MDLRLVASLVALATSASIGEEANSSGNPCGRFPYPNHASDTFVHLFEWKWRDIALECETYLGPQKFTAVQISPPTDHIQGSPWWTRYQPVTYNLTSRSGTEAELKDMIDRCNRVGVRIYVDLVLNQVASGSGTSIMGHPFGGRRTPHLNPNDFHHNSNSVGANCQISNWHNQYNVQTCDLLGMPDTCTGCNNFRRVAQAYIQKMEAMGVAGFRIDAAKHMNAGELSGLLGNGRQCFYFMEVIYDYGSDGGLLPEAYQNIGKVTEFRFKEYLGQNLMPGQKMAYIKDIASWGILGGDRAVTFIDNHDTQRETGQWHLTYKNGMMYQLANLWMLALPYGYPKIMSSYYFSNKDAGPPGVPVHNGDGSVNCGYDTWTRDPGGKPWVCEHRWKGISNMVAWRKSAGSAGISWWKEWDKEHVGYCRGNTACIIFNRGASGHFHMYGLKLPRNRCYWNVICIDHCQIEVCIDGNAHAYIYVPGLTGVAFHTGAPARVYEEEEQAFENVTLV